MLDLTDAGTQLPPVISITDRTGQLTGIHIHNLRNEKVREITSIAESTRTQKYISNFRDRHRKECSAN